MTGPIPGALGRLANLDLLHLGFNGLTGRIPEQLGNLTRLRILDLRWNALTGPFPEALGSLPNLEALAVGGNDLTGAVPAWLGRLTRLRTLDVRSNALTGPVPDALGSLVNLEVLDLGVNRLTGPFPVWSENLTRLRILRLDWNDFAGPLPAGLGNLASLEELNLANSWGLSGPLPAGLRGARLERLDTLVTRTCAPAAWRDWLAAIEFNGRLCETGADVTIDVAVVHTEAARRAAGGAAAIEAIVDLVIAQTNEAFVNQRVECSRGAGGAVRGAVRRDGQCLARPPPPRESGGRSHGRGARPARPRRGRCRPPHGRRVQRRRPGLYPGRFRPRSLSGTPSVFTHELGHNLGLWHDRYEVDDVGAGWGRIPGTVT